jgi:hypothetical protein
MSVMHDTLARKTRPRRTSTLTMPPLVSPVHLCLPPTLLHANTYKEPSVHILVGDCSRQQPAPPSLFEGEHIVCTLPAPRPICSVHCVLSTVYPILLCTVHTPCMCTVHTVLHSLICALCTWEFYTVQTILHTVHMTCMYKEYPILCSVSTV